MGSSEDAKIMLPLELQALGIGKGVSSWSLRGCCFFDVLRVQKWGGKIPQISQRLFVPSAQKIEYYMPSLPLSEYHDPSELVQAN